MNMAPEVGVLGGEVGEAGFGFGAVGGFGSMPPLLLLGLGGAAVVALLLLSRKK